LRTAADEQEIETMMAQMWSGVKTNKKSTGAKGEDPVKYVLTDIMTSMNRSMNTRRTNQIELLAEGDVFIILMIYSFNNNILVLEQLKSFLNSNARPSKIIDDILQEIPKTTKLFGKADHPWVDGQILKDLRRVCKDKAAEMNSYFKGFLDPEFNDDFLNKYLGSPGKPGDLIKAVTQIKWRPKTVSVSQADDWSFGASKLRACPFCPMQLLLIMIEPDKPTVTNPNPNLINHEPSVWNTWDYYAQNAQKTSSTKTKGGAHSEDSGIQTENVEAKLIFENGSIINRNEKITAGNRIINPNNFRLVYSIVNNLIGMAKINGTNSTEVKDDLFAVTVDIDGAELLKLEHKEVLKALLYYHCTPHPGQTFGQAQRNFLALIQAKHCKILLSGKDTADNFIHKMNDSSKPRPALSCEGIGPIDDYTAVFDSFDTVDANNWIYTINKRPDANMYDMQLQDDDSGKENLIYKTARGLLQSNATD
jgi:hypothetical protein